MNYWIEFVCIFAWYWTSTQYSNISVLKAKPSLHCIHSESLWHFYIFWITCTRWLACLLCWSTSPVVLKITRFHKLTRLVFKSFRIFYFMTLTKQLEKRANFAVSWPMNHHSNHYYHYGFIIIHKKELVEAGISQAVHRKVWWFGGEEMWINTYNHQPPPPTHPPTHTHTFLMPVFEGVSISCRVSPSCCVFPLHWDESLQFPGWVTPLTLSCAPENCL